MRVKAEAEAIIARVMLALTHEAKLSGSSLPNFQISEIDLICLSSTTFFALLLRPFARSFDHEIPVIPEDCAAAVAEFLRGASSVACYSLFWHPLTVLFNFIRKSHKNYNTTFYHFYSILVALIRL